MSPLERPSIRVGAFRKGYRSVRARAWTAGGVLGCLLASLASGGMIVGCGERPPGEGPVVRPDLDPQLLLVDHGAPRQRFDGQGGSLLLGAGWAPAERERSEAAGFAWAIDGSSGLYFGRPPASELDFYARCRPLTHGEGAPQAFALILNHRPIGRVEMRPGWQEIRVPLPGEGLGPGLNRLRLVFDRAERPKDLGWNDDERRLSAAFSELAILPRSVEDPNWFLRATALDLDARRIELPLGGSSAFPLPPRASVVLRLGAVESDCSGCRLRIRMLDPARGDETFWEGAPEDASGKRIRFVTGARGFSRLALEAVGSTGSSVVAVSLPEDFLALAVREDGHVSRMPHIFLYMVDTLRADALEPYGAGPGSSPRIAAFSKDAVTYSTAWAPSSWTLPSVVSILTGVYPLRHGIMKGDRKFSLDNAPSLPVLLAPAGYQSLAVSQSYVAGPAFGIGTGFDAFFLNDQLNGGSLRSQDVRGYLHQWLLARAAREQPLFAYLHSVDPHAPYAPPAPFRRLAEESSGSLPPEMYSPRVFLREGLASDPIEVGHLSALYAGEVQYADAEFGRFLDMLETLGLYRDSIVILTSDHGEEFGEHGGLDHGRTLYEELLRVPLIVKFPRSQWAGTEIAARVSAVDLVPTLLDYLEIEGERAALDGRSILPPRLAAGGRDRRVVFAEVSPEAAELLAAVDLRAIALGKLKCIENRHGVDRFHRSVPRWESFDLSRDPGERAPLPAGDPRAAACGEALHRWVQRRATQADPPAPETGLEDLEKLRALGYVK